MIDIKENNKIEIKSIFIKYEETIRYLIFGVLTVIVNTLAYSTLALVMPDIVSNTIAFMLAVQFAYLTNTKFVFKQKYSMQSLRKFWGLRIGTIIIDNGLLYILLSMQFDNIISKLIVNFVITVLNYIFSKFLIFK